MEHRTIEIAPPGPSDDPLCDWPSDLRKEFQENEFNGVVGTVLVSESDRVRVWHLSLPVGARLSFHRHVLDYFWTALTSGVARGYYHDGRIVDAYHYPGETKHFRHTAGEYFVHAVENIGDTELKFVTVEFLQGNNPPLPIPDSVRLKAVPSKEQP